MAIAFDNKSTVSFDDSSQILAHTCSGSSRFLILGVSSVAAPPSSAPTYNGVSMSLADFLEPPSSVYAVYLYYLANPASGNNNISISFTGTTDAALMAVSYTGVAQSDSLDTTAKASNTSKTTDITTSQANELIVGIFADDDDSASNRSPVAGVTERHDILAGSGIDDYGGWTGDRIETSAGTYTVGYTDASASGSDRIVAAFKQGIVTYSQDNSARGNIITTYYSGHNYSWKPSTEEAPNRGYNS